MRDLLNEAARAALQDGLCFIEGSTPDAPRFALLTLDRYGALVERAFGPEGIPADDPLWTHTHMDPETLDDGSVKAGQVLAPVPMGEQEVAALLRDIAAVVEQGDSFEGSVSYEMPDIEDLDTFAMVRAVYRIGNSMGQGGVRMLGEWQPDRTTGSCWRFSLDGPSVVVEVGPDFDEMEQIGTLNLSAHDWNELRLASYHPGLRSRIRFA